MSERGLLYVIVIAISWLGYFRLKQFKSRQRLLLLVSYLLYASWGLQFAIFLFLSSLFNFVAGRWLRRQPGAFRLWLGVLANLVCLATFKYSSVMSVVSRHLHSSGVVAAGSSANVFLPIGISFWTFQALSYLFDLYRGEDLQPSLLEFLLYMSFWPTVLSGPICRLGNLLPQFRSTPGRSSGDLRSGLDRICIGIAMVGFGQILANGFSRVPGLDSVFDGYTGNFTALDVWCVAIGYGFQLFLNFSGYSHVVIGAARMFRIGLQENFDRPYLAASPSEFWTRWHMSLSFWIRDYLFLPLAMLRREKWWRNVALVVSMVAFGLWHGWSVLFALWGLYQGALLVLHRQWQHLRRVIGIDLPRVIDSPLAWSMTFGSICFGWIFFRANNLSQALNMCGAVFSLPGYAHHVLPAALYAMVVTVVAGYLGLCGIDLLVKNSVPRLSLPMELRYSLYTIAFYIGVLHTAQSQAFIYFQF